MDVQRYDVSGEVCESCQDGDGVYVDDVVAHWIDEAGEQRLAHSDCVGENWRPA